MRNLGFTLVVGVAVATFCGLGVWQIQRLAWKEALIKRVDARVHAPAVTAPANGAQVTAERDEYRHVTVRGHFRGDAASQVYALTDYGAGDWVMTPLVREDGSIVYINRGFVPQNLTTPVATPSGEVTVTGLLRMPETKGWMFSQANDPARDAWYHRDIAAMTHKHGLTEVAPYFIDADATPNPGGWPRGGLTVVRFANSHLVYAITWFALAAMLAGMFIRLTWFRKPE